MRAERAYHTWRDTAWATAASSSQEAWSRQTGMVYPGSKPSKILTIRIFPTEISPVQQAGGPPASRRKRLSGRELTGVRREPVPATAGPVMQEAPAAEKRATGPEPAKRESRGTPTGPTQAGVPRRTASWGAGGRHSHTGPLHSASSGAA